VASGGFAAVLFGAVTALYVRSLERGRFRGVFWFFPERMTVDFWRRPWVRIWNWGIVGIVGVGGVIALIVAAVMALTGTEFH
jgi:hypothetical protein